MYSEPGQGCCFKLRFPVAVVDDNAELTGDQPETPRQGNERILLVEDDPGVRALTETILRMHGQVVHAAASPKEALQLHAGLGASPRMLLTDVVLLGLSGNELADQLLAQQPGLCVMFMSGYTDNAIMHRGVLDAGVQFIHKPFSVEQLAHEVRAVLDAGGNGHESDLFTPQRTG